MVICMLIHGRIHICGNRTLLVLLQRWAAFLFRRCGFPSADRGNVQSNVLASEQIIAVVATFGAGDRNSFMPRGIWWGRVCFGAEFGDSGDDHAADLLPGKLPKCPHGRLEQSDKASAVAGGPGGRRCAVALVECAPHESSPWFQWLGRSWWGAYRRHT